MDRDLLLSILSMDAYNRGYGAGITLQATSHIGNAKILADSENRPDIQGGLAAGFYAIAYDYAGEKIISYRGTAESKGSGSDKWYGWTLGAGFPQASQGGLALDFFKSVTGRTVFDATVGGITLTGHSLAGC